MIVRLLILALPIASVLHAAAPVNFSRDIQPLLSENCYHCHGPDAKAREADLRLDVKDGPEGAYRSADGITVIKPGNSKDSELIARIFTDDEDDVMPPLKSNRTLTPAQKDLLKRWVDEGAEWGEHWAFKAPVRPEVPKPDVALGVVRNPIDAFILDRLATEKLRQAPEAEKTKLLRRVTLDLTGIPPTLEELDAFLADARADAYERAVDRLLASPRYGERMVWEWLEAARYADTNGYQGDPTRSMYYWRDWAIDAFNRNQPYDQFTIEQLAGDLLPGPTEPQLIATGFHRNHMINGEGGRIPEESRVEYVFDRIETTGTVWMGLTFNCCRCHDHKFDPLTQKEYYQLGAYFNSIDETGGADLGGLANPVISFANPEQQKKIDALKVAEMQAMRDRDALERKLKEEQAAWEKAMLTNGKQPEVRWHLLKPDEVFSDHGTQLTKLEDGSVLANGPSPKEDDYVVVANVDIGELTAFKLEVLPHESFTNQGPGRAPENGNFVLTELELQGSGKPVDLAGVNVSFAQQGFSEKGPFDGDANKGGWALQPEFGKPQTLVFEARGKVGYGSNVQLSFRLMQRFGRQHTIGRFKLYATADNAALLRPLPDRIRTLLAKPEEQRSEDERKELTKLYLETNPALIAAREKRDAARQARERAEKEVPRTMVMRERAQPRKTTVLIKGAYNAPADEVQHGVPAKLSPLPADAARNRLALARWLMAPEHPLTARVTVNRFWQQFFGTGLVKTVDDFGVQGDKPSHPELLDWLAVEFRESGWDVKKLVRLMVTSASYRQSARVPAGMAERDPENRLLARGPRFRWPSWMLRDQALAVSGLLVEKIGGPPVKGYQPAGVWEDATFGQIRYTQEKGEALYRRSLYTFWRRIVGPTMFFDVSNRQGCTVRTGRTNTPLHALVTMNDVTFVEAARALAQRTLQSATSKDDAARVGEMYRRCTARMPSAAEVDVLLKRLAVLRATYGEDAGIAKQLLGVGEMKADAGLSPVEMASWTGIALMVLNLDEVLSKE